MPDLPWCAEPEERESLAVSLRAVLAGAGHTWRYEEIVSLLGLGALTVAAADEGVALWSRFARDAALLETVPLLGLRLRELHPREAAAGLTQSAEFPEHFRDSYIPLIEGASAHGQGLLVWRGWPPPAEYEWGVVTHAEHGRVVGRIMGHDEPMPLVGAAHQVYVIEESIAVNPPPLARFAHVARVALAGWRDRLMRVPGIQTGDRAYQMWHRLTLCPAPESFRDAFLVGQTAMAGALWHTREQLARWLRRIGCDLPGRNRTAADAWADACDEVAACFERLIPRGATGPAADGRAAEVWVAAIEKAQSIESRFYSGLADTVDR
jgi:hypothetical protein